MITSEEALHTITIELHLQVNSFNCTIVLRDKDEIRRGKSMLPFRASQNINIIEQLLAGSACENFYNYNSPSARAQTARCAGNESEVRE